MDRTDPQTGLPHYDRDYLLSPAKRNKVVELWEVEKFGRDSFGGPDAVALYGMRPAEWHAKGVRILARTLLEAVRETHAFVRYFQWTAHHVYCALQHFS